MPRPSALVAEDDALSPERLFAGLAGSRGIVAAVSGGVDSTALMLLLARWTERPPVLVVSIDHGLRPEAAHEAQLVAENAARLGLPVRIMQAPQRLGTGNLQDWARRARYALLAQAARDADYDTIVTAHHREDQAETFLLRLARGSGVYGLAAMREEALIEGIRLVRPLLDVPREALATVAAAGRLPTVDDPSNTDVRFDRVRMRGLLPVMAEHGMTAQRLSATVRHLRRAATALEHYAQACLRQHFHADGFGTVSGPADALSSVPDEIALRALALVCQAAGGSDYTPRLDRVEKLYTAVVGGAGAGGEVGFKRTLHGTTFELATGVLTARREWGRAGLPAVAAPAARPVLWDRRFRLDIPEHVAATHVGPLGCSGRRLRSPGLPRWTLRTLPGLYGEEGLLAVPQGVETADEGPALGRLAAECLVASRLGLASSQPLRSP